jgi:hypothetical protein
MGVQTVAISISLLVAGPARAAARCSAEPPIQEERLLLQGKEVLAAGLAFVTRVAPGARRYEYVGARVDSRVLAFAATRAKLVVSTGALEARIAGEARDVTVRVETGPLAWIHAEEASLPLTYRVGSGNPVHCELTIVHSDTSPQWEIGISPDPSCVPPRVRK